MSEPLYKSVQKPVEAQISNIYTSPVVPQETVASPIIYGATTNTGIPKTNGVDTKDAQPNFGSQTMPPQPAPRRLVSQTSTPTNGNTSIVQNGTTDSIPKSADDDEAQVGLFYILFCYFFFFKLQ